MKLIFATNNPHKLEEMQAVIGDKFQLVSLREAGIEREIPEPFDTLAENAAEKADTIHRLTQGGNCFSEDTGLEADALDGAPGVRTARYAGEHASAEDNISKLLEALKTATVRTARFRTVICLILDNDKHYFEGICEGSIANERSGGKGFGYDPVFIPAGATRSFASMTLEEKSQYSHRRKAADKLIAHLDSCKL